MSNSKFNKIKQSFKDNQTPYYFVSPTNFNLMDMCNWVNKWSDINYINCYDGISKYCFLPKKNNNQHFESLEQINKYLLAHNETQSKINKETTEKNKGNVIFLFFNKELESICKNLNLNILLPRNDMVKHIDNKITTTEIGNNAKVFSVDNYLGKVKDFNDLKSIAKEHNLGPSWVVQTPFGDSGKTTFFIKSEEDYNKHSDQIEEEDTVKVMKMVNCIGSAIEACATSKGTFVGPLLGELIGFPELTPYKGGWCGNELYDDNFSNDIRKVVHERTERLGDELYKCGYKGYFEVDYLIDLDTNEIYLGEINPRITGISAMTNMSPFCQSTIPLFLFHLLEYSNNSIEFTPKEYNEISLKQGAIGVSSQMIFKSSHSGLKIATNTPASGVYEMTSQGDLTLVKASSTPIDKALDQNRVFILRIMQKDDYSYKGADTIILFLNIKITEQGGVVLSGQARQWIDGANNLIKFRELTEEEEQLNKRFLSPSTTKGGD